MARAALLHVVLRLPPNRYAYQAEASGFMRPMARETKPKTFPTNTT